MELEKAKKYIEDGHAVRAVMYKKLFDEMVLQLGEEKATEVFKQATYKRGREIRQQFEPFLNAGDFKGLADYFCSSSMAEGTLFFPSIEQVDPDKAVVTMKGCPLAKTWINMGLSREEVSKLCEVASAVDYGTFESDNTKLDITHSLARGDELCRLVVSKR